MWLFPLIWLILCFKFQMCWPHENVTMFWFILYTIVANHFKFFFFFFEMGLVELLIGAYPFEHLWFSTPWVFVAVFGYGLLWICDFGVCLKLRYPFELFVIVTLYFNFSTKSFWQWCLSFCKLNLQKLRFLFSHLN